MAAGVDGFKVSCWDPVWECALVCYAELCLQLLALTALYEGYVD